MNIPTSKLPSRRFSFSRLCRLAAVMLFLIGGLIPATAVAENPWPERIQAARATFRPIGKKDTEQAIKRIEAALKKVYDYTERDTPLGRRWQKYLWWQRLHQQLAKGDDQDVDFWITILRRITKDSALLDNESFIEYRSAIRNLIDVTEARQVDDLQKEYQDTLNRLSAALPATPDKLTSANAETISEILSLLHRRQQAKELTQQVRDVFSQPNVLISMPLETAKSMLEGKSTETSPVRDVIDGAQVRGTARTAATQKAVFSESESEIKLALHVNGTSKSDTVSYAEGVRVDSRSVLNFNSTATLEFNRDGIKTSPFKTEATLRYETYDVTPPGSLLGFRDGIARRRAYERQPIARREAERKAIVQLNATMAKTLKKTLDPLSKGYQSNIRRPLLCLDLFPSKTKFRVADGGLHAGYYLDRGHLLAAPNAPAYEGGEDILVLSFHQTAYNNSLQAAFANRRLLLTDLFADLFASEEDAESKPSEKEAAESPDSPQPRELFITLARQDPLQLTIREGELTLAIKSQQYDLEGRNYAAMEIQLKYRLDKQDGQWVFASQKPEILMPRRADGTRPKLGIRHYSLRRMLLNEIDRRQPTRVVASDVLSSLTQGDTVKLADVQLQEGWIHFGLKLEKEADKLTDAKQDES